jgi:type II secretory pathway pseudopilin PulG
MNQSGQGQNPETPAGRRAACEAGRGAGLRAGERSGYAMAALLVALAVMAVVMSVALPAWRQANQREKEEELVFRGRQYVRAIQLFQRRFAATYPPDVDTLVKQKLLRKKYKDPMVEDGEFEVIYQGSLLSVTPGGPGARSFGGGVGIAGDGQRGQGSSFTFDSRSGAVTQGSTAGRTAGPRGGVLGVRSKSTEASIRVYNGATHYNEWQFVFVPAMTGPGQARPGMRGGQGTPGGMPGGMPGGRGPGTGGRGGPGVGGERGGGQRGGRGPGG